MDRIVFCVYKSADYRIYFNLLPSYFPAAKMAAAKLGGSQISVKAAAATNKLRRRPKESGGALDEQVIKTEIAGKAIQEQGVANNEKLTDLVKNLEKSGEEKSRKIAEGESRIQSLEVRVKHLESQLRNTHLALNEAHQHVDQIEWEKQEMELRLSHSDTVFQEVLQRLVGQIPQSQPFWAVARQEINLTDEKLGEGGWATVSVAMFRGQRVAAKCLHNLLTMFVSSPEK